MNEEVCAEPNQSSKHRGVCDSEYPRLESQIDWYDRKSGSAQLYYKFSRFTVLVLATAIPVMSILQWTYIVTISGALIAILEGLQQLNQWHHNWITYRSTCEWLRHEKFTYIERAGEYRNLSDKDARVLLAERVESLISTEHTKWISVQEQAEKDRAQERQKRAQVNTIEN